MSPEKYSIDPDWTVRELLRLSQTDVTPDPAEGLYYAMIAYDRAKSPDILSTDPTAAGEAAAKASFRSVQLGQPETESDKWLNRSVDALHDSGPNQNREHIATHLLAGRGSALRFLKSDEANSRLETKAVVQFELADEILAYTPQHGAWIPYATMLHAQHATFEAVRPAGSAAFAGKLALRGISSAIYSKVENANSTADSEIAAAVKHAKFVGKHVLLNTVALGLAASKPVEKIFKPLAKLRRNLARRLIG